MSKAQKISEIIERIGWGKYNIYLFIMIAFTCMLIFYGAALGAITTREAEKDWGLDKFIMSQLGTAQLSGLFLGSFFWGNIANHHGRIMVLRICLCITFVTFLIFTFSFDFFMAISIIFIQGIGFAGMLSTAPATYYECCPPKKAWTMVLVSWSLCLGLILGNLVAFITVFTGDYGIARWRWVSGVGTVLSLITLFLSYWVLESPRYLDLRGRSAEAQEVLKTIAKWNKSTDSGKIDTPIITFNSNVQSDEEELEIDELIKPAEKVEFRELFCVHHIKKSLALAAIGLLGDLGYFGLIEFMPYFLSNIPNKVTDDAHIYGTILLQITLGSTGTFASSKLVDTRFGRKWTMIISYLCCGVFSFLFIIANSYWLILVSTVLIYFFNYIGFAAFFLLVPENYPTNIRAIGQSWVNAASKFGGVLSPFTLGLLVKIDNGVIIGIFLIALSFGLVGAFGLLVKETRGRGMDAVSLSDTIKD